MSKVRHPGDEGLAADAVGMETLVEELEQAGNLPVDNYADLLRAVDRAPYIPAHIWVDGRPVSQHDNLSEWTAAVYSDRSIVGQFDFGSTTWPRLGTIPTVSTLKPSVTLAMLDALDVQEGMSVFEIGTGTGWNAALLSHQVGSTGEVYTIEIDKGTHVVAKDRLSGRSWNTGCGVGDGTEHMEWSRRFDAVISTVAVRLGSFPYTWVTQCEPGSVIVCPVRADFGDSRAEFGDSVVVRFVVGDNGVAIGRALPMSIVTEETRMQRVARTTVDELHKSFSDVWINDKVSAFNPFRMFESPAARWTMAVGLPSVCYGVEPATERRPYEYVWLHDPMSGSGAMVSEHAGQYHANQHGVRELWTEAVNAYSWWMEHSKPGITDWAWIVTPDHQSVHLSPDL